MKNLFCNTCGIELSSKEGSYVRVELCGDEKVVRKKLCKKCTDQIIHILKIV